MDEAATKVRMSRKSLDDYLSHLRSAKRFGFNFTSNSMEKFGVIRQFVKAKKLEAQ